MALRGAVGEDEASGARPGHALSAQTAAVAAADFGQLERGGLKMHVDFRRRAGDSGQHHGRSSIEFLASSGSWLVHGSDGRRCMLECFIERTAIRAKGQW